jgi:hypothetical protein
MGIVHLMRGRVRRIEGFEMGWMGLCRVDLLIEEIDTMMVVLLDMVTVCGQVCRAGWVVEYMGRKNRKGLLEM